jgi:hypothetical protein
MRGRKEGKGRKRKEGKGRNEEGMRKEGMMKMRSPPPPVVPSDFIY